MKIKVQKIVGNLLHNLQELFMNGTGRCHLEIFSHPQ